MMSERQVPNAGMQPDKGSGATMFSPRSGVRMPLFDAKVKL